MQGSWRGMLAETHCRYQWRGVGGGKIFCTPDGWTSLLFV